MNSNHRQQPRKVPTGFTFIQLERDDGGRVLNISEEGLSFEVFSPVCQSDPVRFWLSLDLHERIDVLGKIVWVDATKTVGGLRFVDLSQHVRERIRTWMNADSAPVGTAGEDRLATSPPLHASADHPSELGHADVTLHLNEQVPHTVIGSSQAQAICKAFEGTQLVPLERYLSATRSRFIHGLLVGVLASSTLAVLVFKYAYLPQHRRFLQETSEQTSLGNSGAQVTSAVPNSSSDTSPTSFTSSNLAKSQRSNSSSYNPDNPVQSSLVGHRLQSAASSTGVNGTHSPGLPLSGESKRGKKNSATPEQLWASVQAGNAKAAVALADLYIRGEGVPVNCNQARVLLLVASEKNNKEAIIKLRDLDKDTTSCSGP